MHPGACQSNPRRCVYGHQLGSENFIDNARTQAYLFPVKTLQLPSNIPAVADNTETDIAHGLLFQHRWQRSAEMRGPDATVYPSASHVLQSGRSTTREPLTPLTLASSWGATASAFHELKDQDISQYETALYASGSLPRPKTFSFAESSIRIDWRALAGVDIDHLVCSSWLSACLVRRRYSCIQSISKDSNPCSGGLHRY